MYWCGVLLAGQRLYFSENSKSKLRGMSACLRADAPVLLGRAPGERGRALLPDHCQVGFAVRFIIDGISFLCVGMKKAQDLVGA